MPSGQVINGTGINPDIVVVADDPRARYRQRNNDGVASGDNQLQEALHLIGFNPADLE